jgi:hypothetical protein
VLLGGPLATGGVALVASPEPSPTGSGLENALQTPHFYLLGTRRRRAILVQQSRFGLRDVFVRKRQHDYDLTPAERASDGNFVADPKIAMRLGHDAVHADTSDFAFPLRLRSRLEQTRDVEPHVEAYGV